MRVLNCLGIDSSHPVSGLHMLEVRSQDTGSISQFARPPEDDVKLLELATPPYACTIAPKTHSASAHRGP